MKGTGRVEAFSDGVFAIAITLLVLDLKVPPQPPLLAALLAEWPVFAAYLISSEQSTATAVYTGWFLLIALCFNLVWRYAAHHGRLSSGAGRQPRYRTVAFDEAERRDRA